MAEYYAVLSKAVAGLTESAEARRKVYDKARNALIGQLKAIDPPLPTTEISRQRLELEEAIRRVEREASAAALTAAPKAPRRASPQRPPAGPEQREATSAHLPQASSPEDVFRRAVEEASADERAARPAPLPPAEPETEYAAPDDGAYGYPASTQQPPPDRGAQPQPQSYEPPQRPVPQHQTVPEPHDGRQQPPAHHVPEPGYDENARTDRYDRHNAVESQHVSPDQDYGREWDANADVQPAAAPAPYVARQDRPMHAPSDRRRPRGKASDRDLMNRPQRRSRLPAIILSLLLLLLVGALGAIGWSQRDRIQDLIAVLDQNADTPPDQQTTQPREGGLSEPAKVADRLLSGQDDAQVRDVGQQPEQLASPFSGGNLDALVAQTATLYEEPLNATADGEGVIAIDADVTWSFSGSSLSGPEVIADINVPDRNLRIRLSVRRNDDETLPASHLVEIVSEGLIVKINQVPRLVLKATEGGRGQPLVGAAAKVAEGLFWIALSSAPDDIVFNTGLLRDREWIDLPLVYESGQRAILTFEKGTPGARVMRQALAAWGG